MTLAERVAKRAALIERHLARVEALLPPSPDALLPMSTESDGVVLHLWQAVQATIDLAAHLCAQRGLGPPEDYAGAFRALASSGVIDSALANRLVRAVGFRNAVAQGYESLDLARVWLAAKDGPADLRAFLAVAARCA